MITGNTANSLNFSLLLEINSPQPSKNTTPEIQPATHGISETATQDRARPTRYDSKERPLEDYPPIAKEVMERNRSCIKNC